MLFVRQTALTECSYQEQTLKRPLLFSRKHLHVESKKKGRVKVAQARKIYLVCAWSTAEW